jgi:protein TonB
MFRRHLTAFTLVALLHVTFFWILARYLRPAIWVNRISDLQVTVFNPQVTAAGPQPPPLSWMFQAPEDVEVPEPEISILPGPGAPTGMAAAIKPQFLPPRPDPEHLNAPPDLPPQLRGLASTSPLQLQMLVLPDGTIADVKILRSSGNTDIDAITIAFVKENWRYLPASVGDKFVEHWITGYVRFAHV